MSSLASSAARGVGSIGLAIVIMVLPLPSDLSNHAPDRYLPYDPPRWSHGSSTVASGSTVIMYVFISEPMIAIEVLWVRRGV
jgi:hypothetical protein